MSARSMARASGLALSLALPLGLGGCGGTGAPEGPGNGTFSAIAPDEAVQYTGTEPFWGGAAERGMATYLTPERPEAPAFPVQRFAGNNGLGFSGSVDGASFDLTITPGACSDGMSDRTYPFTATLLIGSAQRQGCAWTERQPFTGPAAP